MLAERKLSRVTAQPGRAGDLLTQARRHVDSATKVATDDPTLAIAACHDAIRKSIDAHAGVAGIRVENSKGHHRTVLDYARHEMEGVLTIDDLDEADRLRNRRHKTEYGELPTGALSEPEIQHFIQLADRVVRAVTDDVAHR